MSGNVINWVSDGGNIGTDCSISATNPALTFELLDISPPGAEAKTIDMTHMGSTDFKQFLPGKIIEWGACTFEVAYLPGTDQNPNDALTLTTKNTEWDIAFPTEAQDNDYTEFIHWKFKGYISEMEVKTPLEDRVTANMTINVSEWTGVFDDDDVEIV